MKLQSISDIECLPSVLDISLVNERLIELVDILYRDNIASLAGAEAINELISYQTQNESGLSIEVSKVILAWVEKNYDPKSEENVCVQTANLANLTCSEARDYLLERLNLSRTELEASEVSSALSEIRVRT